MVSKINNNLISVGELKIPAIGLIPPKAILRDVSLINKSDADGKRTNEVEAVRYDLIDPITFSTFSLKVAGTHPVISKLDLDKSENPIYLEIPLEEVNIKPYRIDFGKATLSITAPTVKLAK